MFQQHIYKLQINIPYKKSGVVLMVPCLSTEPVQFFLKGGNHLNEDVLLKTVYTFLLVVNKYSLFHHLYFIFRIYIHFLNYLIFVKRANVKQEEGHVLLLHCILLLRVGYICNWTYQDRFPLPHYLTEHSPGVAMVQGSGISLDVV